MNTRSTIKAIALGIAALTALTLTGCSAGGSANNEKVTLNYWAWAPNMSDVVKKWNDSHPNIQVKVTEAAGADDVLAKLSAAKRAGNAPDIAQAEYQKLPNLVTSGIAADISGEVGSMQDKFSKATWKLTDVGGKTYGVPQDTGPMVFMYRADLFEKYGLTPPRTWDEYAALAAKVKQVDPKAFLGGYPDDASTFAAYTQPSGASWWKTDGKSWTVDIDSTAAKRNADFWQGLVDKGEADTTHFFTPEWNTMMNNGTLLSWTAGMWAPGTLESVAPDTAGKWKVAAMPRWDGETTVGLMGGSSTIVTKDSKHEKQAVEFLDWLNASKAGSSRLASVGGLFPASIAGQESLKGSTPPKLVSDQSDFWSFAADTAKDTANVTWGPNTQVAFDSWSDGIKQAVQNKSSFADVLPEVQQDVISDLKKSGFTVK